MNEARVEPTKLAKRLVKLRDALGVGLIERETPVRLALLAALSGEHLLLIGPPGTAKSELARRLRGAFSGATYFERLLTKFSVPEELFGPLSIKALGEDRYHRQTMGYLPQASVAFLDEIFKANSAILNALLTLLNERVFDNGVEREPSRLIAVIGASNELPEQHEQLDALYDRFLFRCSVPLLSAEGFPRLLDLREESVPEPNESLRLSMETIAEVQREAAQIELTAEVADLLASLRHFLQQQKIEVSDRRWRKIKKVLQVSAFTNGRSKVSRWDCWLLQHCTWSRPEERETVQKWYEERMGTASQMDFSDLLRLTAQLESQLAQEHAQQEQARNEKGQPLYAVPGEDKTSTSSTGTRAVRRNYEDVKEKYDIPPLMQPKQYSIGHIQKRVQDVEALEEELATFLAEVDAHLASITKQVDEHLWISPGFAEPARRVLQQTRNDAAALSIRLTKLREGFEKLPRSKEDIDVSASLSSRRARKSE